MNPAREQRRAQRKKVLWSGAVECDGVSWPCLILDLSASGAKVHFEKTNAAAPPPPRDASIALASKRFPTLRGTVVWRRGDSAGITFEASPAQVAALLDGVLPLIHADTNTAKTD